MKTMKEKEFMELLNALAKDVTEHEKEIKESAFARYYIVDKYHFMFTVQYNYYRNAYVCYVSAGSIFSVSRTHEIEGRQLSTLFVELPRTIVSILRELNSRD